MRALILSFLLAMGACPGLGLSMVSAASADADAALIGDLDSDGALGIFDLLALLKVLGSDQDTLSPRLIRIANLHQPGTASVDIFDLLELLKTISGRSEPQTAVFYTSVADHWALGDGEKVFRSEASHFSRDSNSVYNGREIYLRGLYNEVLAFQVLLVADSAGANGVEVQLDSLVHVQTGAIIGASPATPYGPAGYLEVFSQHYLQVVNPTQPNWFYGANAAPGRMTGWIPDALIPPQATGGRGGFPLDMAAGNVQGFWFDLYCPRDSLSMPPGEYRGTVRVIQQGWTVASIPVRLELLPAYLPDENHSWTWLFHSGVESYFDSLSDGEVDRQMHHLAHRHRIDLAGGFKPHHSDFDSTMLAEYLPWLDGSGYTEAQGYYGPGQGRGEWLFPIGMYGSITNKSMQFEFSVGQEAPKWVDWFADNAPGVRYFWYLVDEPGADQYDWIKERAGWVHDQSGSGKNLPVFITENYIAELDGEIDIWAGHNGVDLAKLPELKEQGKDHWFYNGARPRYGSIILEGEAVDMRVNAWARYIHQVNVWFQWHGSHWQHNHQGPRAQTHQDIFADPVTFLSSSGAFGNGDGVVFYPGREPFHPDQDRGVEGVFGSIRLKNIRRGQQDYELMWLAEQKVGREAVLALVRQVVPRALNEVGMDEQTPWSQRGNDFDRIKNRLLEIIAVD